MPKDEKIKEEEQKEKETVKKIKKNPRTNIK